MIWSTDTDDAKMLLEILFTTNYVIIDQLALNFVDICFDNTLQILCKSLLYFAKLGNMFNFKIVNISLNF